MACTLTTWHVALIIRNIIINMLLNGGAHQHVASGGAHQHVESAVVVVFHLAAHSQTLIHHHEAPLFIPCHPLSHTHTQVYYRLSYVDRAIEAPEQRLCEDLPKLCQGLSELTAEVINAVVDATFYSVVLRRYSQTNRYTAAILAYVFGAGAAMTLLAPNFGRLVKKQAALEGSYRQLHSRLRSNAESVAFYGGIDKEGRLLKTKFAELVKHRGRLLATQWRFGIVQVRY